MLVAAALYTVLVLLTNNPLSVAQVVAVVAATLAVYAVATALRIRRDKTTR
jgi:hypothetical protein